MTLMNCLCSVYFCWEKTSQVCKILYSISLEMLTNAIDKLIFLYIFLNTFITSPRLVSDKTLQYFNIPSVFSDYLFKKKQHNFMLPFYSFILETNNRKASLTYHPNACSMSGPLRLLLTMLYLTFFNFYRGIAYYFGNFLITIFLVLISITADTAFAYMTKDSKK